MFDVGFPELVLIAVVGLLVLGPDRLPEALRTLGLWLGRMRRSFTSVKSEIEKEIGMDEIRRQLHNEAVMEEMKRIETEVRSLESMPAVPEKTPAVPAKTGEADAPDAQVSSAAETANAQVENPEAKNSEVKSSEVKNKTELTTNDD